MSYTGGTWITLGTGDMRADGGATSPALDLPGDVNNYIEPGT